MADNRNRSPQESENLIAGRNAVRELLKSGKTIDKLYILKGVKDGLLSVIFAEATRAGVPVVESDRAALDRMAAANQGVIAQIPEREYASLEDIIALAAERGEAPFVVILDCVSDPHNLGAIIRSAECAGCHGVIIPKRRAVGLTPLVSKASAGAVEHLAIAKVSNIGATVRALKKEGVWVFAAEAGGKPYYETDFRGPCALVFGSEGNGVSDLVTKEADMITSIPMYGKVNSFNVSTAASVILAEAAKQHRQG